jgi:hypothetical protein
MKYFQKWKIILGGSIESDRFPLPFMIFCRTIRHLPLKSLDVATVPQNRWDTSENDAKEDLHRLLSSLEVLRSVSRITFRDVRLDQLPIIEAFPEAGHSRLEGEETLTEHISDLVKIQDPVEDFVEMHRCLAQYAIAFERDEASKILMSPEGELFERASKDDLEHLYKIQHNSYVRPRTQQKEHWDWLLKTYPVETGLGRADCAADENNCVEFKKERSAILAYLKAQY